MDIQPNHISNCQRENKELFLFSNNSMSLFSGYLLLTYFNLFLDKQADNNIHFLSKMLSAMYFSIDKL